MPNQTFKSNGGSRLGRLKTGHRMSRMFLNRENLEYVLHIVWHLTELFDNLLSLCVNFTSQSDVEKQLLVDEDENQNSSGVAFSIDERVVLPQIQRKVLHLLRSDILVFKGTCILLDI